VTAVRAHWPRAGSRVRAGLAAAFLLVAAGAQSVPPSKEPTAAQLELGRRLYHEGRNAQGESIKALLAISAVPLGGQAVACGNCHGADGRGRPEGGVLPPDITWEELTKPYGHQHDNGRRHGPFDARSFARAVAEGIDPAGGRIDDAMPRYSLSTTEMAALVAYLKQLSRERDPGIAEATVRVGTLLPDTGAAAATGTAIRAMLRAYIGDLNERGGVHGRRLELEVTSSLEQAEQRFKDQPVFALVSPYAVGAEDKLVAFAAQRKIGVVAPFTMTAVPETSLQTFFLFPGEAELARVLLEFGTRDGDVKTQRWAAFVPDRDGATAHALEQACARRQCGGMEILPSTLASDPGAVARLMHQGTQRILFAGGEKDLGQLIGTADRMGWRPPIYTPVAALARSMLAAPAGFAGKLYAAYPMRADRPSSGANALAFEKLRRSRALGEQHASAQGFAFAAMAIVEEGLRQAGRDLSRERFARAIEGLHRFDAGPLPPISYGPGRRIGVLGGYVVAIEPQRGFRPVSDWIALEGR